MDPRLNRRDFLKLMTALSLATLASRLPDMRPTRAQESARPNLILILFDAMAARNLSLYGYPRQTSPNLEKFAGRALVYHNHHSAGTYTTPSTASLFSGTYPWTHRALTYGSRVIPRREPYNLFRLLHGAYQQVAFTQNLFADTLLGQFGAYLDYHEQLDRFSVAGKVAFNKLFANDPYFGSRSLDQFLFKTGQVHGSLFLGLVNDVRAQAEKDLAAQQLAGDYPDGLPFLPALDHTYFALRQVMDGVMDLTGRLPAGSLAYFHFLSPHEPYKPTRPFLERFDDQFVPYDKGIHPLSDGLPSERLAGYRRTYDQYIANTDDEFGRLVDYLEKAGRLDDSYVFVMSDHGELFERGSRGHGAPFAYENLVRIPLLVSTPGQHARQDIPALTSNIDLLPTLLHLAGLPIPDWAEGQVLPGLGGQAQSDRSIFIADAKENSEFTKLRKGTFALIKGDYKLIHTMGYRGAYQDKYEFYDLQRDGEELLDLYGQHPAAKDLQAELDGKWEEVNAAFP